MKHCVCTIAVDEGFALLLKGKDKQRFYATVLWEKERTARSTYDDEPVGVQMMKPIAPVMDPVWKIQQGNVYAK